MSFLRGRPRFGKLHHKLMVNDDAVVVARSLNRAARRHDFNILVLGSRFRTCCAI